MDASSSMDSPQQIDRVFTTVIEHAESAAQRVDDEATADAFYHWAEQLRNARDMWEEETTEEPRSQATLSDLILAAVDATIVCSASAPRGVPASAVAGGLLAQWMGWLHRVDPGYAQRRAIGPAAVARKIALSWTLPENPDRALADTAYALDQAASMLLCEAPKTERGAVEDAARILAQQLQGHPVPYSAAVVHRYRAGLLPADPASSRRISPRAQHRPVSRPARKEATPVAGARLPETPPLADNGGNAVLRVGAFLLPFLPAMRQDQIVRGIAEAVLAELTEPRAKKGEKRRKSKR
jgi:hypothetical protein